MNKTRQKLLSIFVKLTVPVFIICMLEYFGHLDTEVLFPDGRVAHWLFLSCSFGITGIYYASSLQTFVHESGHLIFGLLTGYRCLAFSVGRFVFTKDNGRWRRKRSSIVGAAGYCVMIPRQISEERVPFFLYYIGGVLFNLVFSLICMRLYLLCDNVPYLSGFLLIISAIGFAYMLINIIPMESCMLNSDGYHILSRIKNKNGHQPVDLWRILEQLYNGVRLKDMPAEWFKVSSPEEMQNKMMSTTDDLSYVRLIDCHKFEEADKLITELLQGDSDIRKFRRGRMICELIYCELLTKNQQDRLDLLLDKDQKQYMKVMKNDSSVLRMEYAYALIAEKNLEEATKIKRRFEKIAHRYLIFVDKEAECELMDLAYAKYNRDCIL